MSHLLIFLQMEYTINLMLTLEEQKYSLMVEFMSSLVIHLVTVKPLYFVRVSVKDISMELSSDLYMQEYQRIQYW